MYRSVIITQRAFWLRPYVHLLYMQRKQACAPELKINDGTASAVACGRETGSPTMREPRRAGARDSRASLDEGLGDFHDLAALARLGLVPHRPNTLGIRGISHEERGRLGLQRVSKRFEQWLTVRLKSAFDARKAGVCDPDSVRHLLEGQSARLPPLPDERPAVPLCPAQTADDALRHVHIMHNSAAAVYTSGVQNRLTRNVRVMYRSRMHLAEYMRAHALRDQDAAELIGVSRWTVSRIRRRKIRPGWRTIEKIRIATAGAVTADDFIGPLDPLDAEAVRCG
jgi:DNA-binding XRE family transcriptional regulator